MLVFSSGGQIRTQHIILLEEQATGVVSIFKPLAEYFR